MACFYTKSIKNKFYECENKILTMYFCKLHSLNECHYIIANIIDNITLF